MLAVGRRPQFPATWTSPWGRIVPSWPGAGFPHIEQSEQEHGRTHNIYYDKVTHLHFHNVPLCMKDGGICHHKIWHFGLKIIWIWRQRKRGRHKKISLPSLSLPEELPSWLSTKESTCQCKRCRRSRFDPWVWKIPSRRKWQPTPVFLPGESLVCTVLGVAKDLTEGLSIGFRKFA